MKRFITVVALLSAVSLTLFAQEEESPGESSRFKRSKSKVGGAGGFTPAWGLFKFDEINKVLKSSGMPPLASDPMYLAGGEGYGYVMFLKNVRMGGKGIGGTVSATSYDPVTKVKKSVDYRVSYGGFLIDYVMPVAEHLDVSVGLTLGGGGVNLTLVRDNGAFRQWDSLWSEFATNAAITNVTRHINGSFFTLQPSASVEYAILQWFQIRMGVTYPYMTGGSWKLEDDAEVLGVPSALKTDGPVITAGIMFGFFN